MCKGKLFLFQFFSQQNSLGYKVTSAVKKRLEVFLVYFSPTTLLSAVKQCFLTSESSKLQTRSAKFVVYFMKKAWLATHC